jgi:hypothetical protein
MPRRRHDKKLSHPVILIALKRRHTSGPNFREKLKRF